MRGSTQPSDEPTANMKDAPASEPEYGDLLLVDILRPDFRHFFSRYRTDLIGFVVISAIIAFIIWATKQLAMIGAGAAVAARAAGT